MTLESPLDRKGVVMEDEYSLLLSVQQVGRSRRAGLELRLGVLWGEC